MLRIKTDIDMFLDGRLTVIYLYHDKEYQTFRWCTPNLDTRGSYSSHERYFPESRQTTLSFEFDNIPKGSVVLCEKSILEIGWAGARSDWVGPCKLFTYSLKSIIGKTVIKVE